MLLNKGAVYKVLLAHFCSQKDVQRLETGLPATDKTMCCCAFSVTTALSRSGVFRKLVHIAYKIKRTAGAD